MRLQTKKSLIAALSAAAALSVAYSAPAFAAKPEVYTGAFSGVAVGGYDPVAYFEDGAPVKGDANFSYDYKGVKWRFASAANRDAFAADPEHFAPQYGGYCAWAASQGYTAPGNPQNWTIVDGRLFLNYNDKVQSDWEKDIPGFIEAADAKWPSILN